MAKIIKFRSWSPAFESSGQQYPNTMRYDSLQVGEETYVHGIDIMLSTGLFDRNDDEIYEGDILMNMSEGGDHNTAFVEWGGARGVKFMWIFSELIARGWTYGLNDPHSWEIIGNKYETPELMKK